MSPQPPVVVLLSGGLDSTALMDFYVRRRATLKCVHFQYGQPSGQSEAKAATEVAEYYKVEPQVAKLEFPTMKRHDEVVGRNAMFVMAAACLTSPPLRIALGIHSGSTYYDCSNTFVVDCQRLLDGYFGGVVRVEAPFLKFEKTDMATYCKANNVPIQLTYSCLRQNYPPCGKCSSCRDRAAWVES
jgi:7-cyano-7-deazaguanine synthase